MEKCKFFSITNPPPCAMEDYTGQDSLTDPSQDEPIGVIVRKLLSGSLKVPPSDVEYDTEDVTALKDVDSFMVEHEPLRPGYGDLSDVQVYAELAKETIARLKRGSKAQTKVEPVPPSDSKKVESGNGPDRSNADLSGNGTQAA
jgi:hypothetical protein